MANLDPATTGALLGAVQGLTEYLPVSSSAHLILAPRVLTGLGYETPEPGLAFDVFLHAGTLLSTLVYFRRDWVALARETLAWIRSGARPTALPRLGWIALATLPALAFGAILHDWIRDALRGNAVLCATLALGGLLLWGVDRWAGRRPGPAAEVTPRVWIWVGLFQCLALIPGMSRSGSTLIGGRLLGLDRVEAARVSFLLSMPVTAAALAYELRHGLAPLQAGGDPAAWWIGLTAAAIFGLLAIGGLLRWIRRIGFGVFAAYRLALAATIALWLGLT